MSPPAPVSTSTLAAALAALALACQGSSKPAAAPPRDAAPPPIDSIVTVTDLRPPVPVDAPPLPATRDVRPATDAFFAQLDGDHADTWQGAHLDFRNHADQHSFARTLDLLRAATGKFQAITEYTPQAGTRPDDNAVIGAAKFERGTARFQLSFRDDGDTPRLVFFNLDLPKDMLPAVTPEGARALADRAVHVLAAGDFEAFRPFLHPATESDFGPDAAKQLREVTAGLGAIKQVAFVEQKECKGAQCVVYEVTGAKAKAKAKIDFVMTTMYGQWLVREFHLVLE